MPAAVKSRGCFETIAMNRSTPGGPPAGACQLASGCLMVWPALMWLLRAFSFGKSWMNEPSVPAVSTYKCPSRADLTLNASSSLPMRNVGFAVLALTSKPGVWAAAMRSNSWPGSNGPAGAAATTGGGAGAGAGAAATPSLAAGAGVAVPPPATVGAGAGAGLVDGPSSAYKPPPSSPSASTPPPTISGVLLRVDAGRGALSDGVPAGRALGRDGGGRDSASLSSPSAARSSAIDCVRSSGLTASALSIVARKFGL